MPRYRRLSSLDLSSPWRPPPLFALSRATCPVHCISSDNPVDCYPALRFTLRVRGLVSLSPIVYIVCPIASSVFRGLYPLSPVIYIPFPGISFVFRGLVSLFRVVYIAFPVVLRVFSGLTSPFQPVPIASLVFTNLAQASG